MINCAVIGATDYTGLELAKILLRHSKVKISGLTTRQDKPIPLRSLLPSLPKDVSQSIEPFDFQRIKQSSDCVFLCLPHTEAMELGKKFVSSGRFVIDLSADFRLRDPKAYSVWYGVKHQAPDLLKQAVYGLPELNRDQISEAELISNPGCYPTASALAILPLIRRKLIEPSNIIIDAKSGVSGAGKKLTAATQFAELDENFYAYKVGGHQHTPEIEQVLSQAAGSKVTVTFTAHLLPVERGILATVYLNRKKGVSGDKIRRAFREDYENEPFVRLLPEGEYPSIKAVQKTNYCDIGIFASAKTDRVIVVSAIDNLVKGAAGQAVQNMNIRYAFSEEEGLKTW